MKVVDLFRRLLCFFSSKSSETSSETLPAEQPQQSLKETSSTSSSANATSNQLNNTTTKMPSVAGKPAGKYDEIPGPLGLGAASLAGKVALVTGAGTYNLVLFLALQRRSIGGRPDGTAFYPI